MRSRQREVVEGPQHQGANERITYALDISQWGSNPTAITAKIFDSAGTDVTSSKMSGTASVLTPTMIQLPQIISLAAGEEYRVAVKFTTAGDIFEAWFTIEAEV